MRMKGSIVRLLFSSSRHLFQKLQRRLHSPLMIHFQSNKRNSFFVNNLQLFNENWPLSVGRPPHMCHPSWLVTSPDLRLQSWMTMNKQRWMTWRISRQRFWLWPLSVRNARWVQESSRDSNAFLKEASNTVSFVTMCESPSYSLTLVADARHAKSWNGSPPFRGHPLPILHPPSPSKPSETVPSSPTPVNNSTPTISDWKKSRND